MLVGAYIVLVVLFAIRRMAFVRAPRTASLTLLTYALAIGPRARRYRPG